MKKKFELWLDESGEFQNEADLKKEGKYPSHVGGILVEKEIVPQIDFTELINPDKSHAMVLKDSDKRNYVLPILEKLHEIGAVQVFFENLGYKDSETSRELYLQIMTEGLIQLLSLLDAEYESVELEVLVAQRQDMKAADPANRRINESEYIEEIQKRFNRKKQLNRVLLDGDTSIKFKLEPAHKSQKIQCADFACNTRLTRSSKAFEKLQDRLNVIYDNALFFSLMEKSTVNTVKMRLAKNNISGAIFDLYSTLEPLEEANRRKLAGLIVSAMQNLSYRAVKAQLKQCSADILAYSQSQDDYEVAEKMFLRIDEEIISLMAEKNLPFENFRLTTLLWLSDAYLREGDIISARRTIDELDKLEHTMGNSLEELLNYYNVLEKKALLCIDEFDYSHARENMLLARGMFEKAINSLPEVHSLKDRFGNFVSEYYGDTLCMELYALMFMQREHPELYDEMCDLSDLAMKQYPQYPGELQRHRQYRSHIEMTRGKFSDAVCWLFLSAEYDEKEISKETLISFMNKVCDNEQSIGCQYYLMYYVLIMAEAKIANDTLGDLMFQALSEQKRLKAYGDFYSLDEDDGYLGINTKGVSSEKTGIEYHPMEVIKWKYGTYLYASGKIQTALRFYDKALAVCRACGKDYMTMLITGLGIYAEKTFVMARSGDKKNAVEELGRVMTSAERIHDANGLTKETRLFVQRIITELREVNKPGQAINAEALWRASRLISY